MRPIIFLTLSTLLLSLFSHAKVEIVENHKFYAVNAKAKKSLLATINQASPIREDGETFHGHTKWNIQWRFWWNSNQKQCQLTKVDASLTITLTMPKLISTNKQVKGVWSRWYPNLLTHEVGHIDLAKATVKNIEESLLAMPPQKSCKLVEKLANSLAQQKMAELSKASKLYDKNTNHGETQGAWLYAHLR